MRCGVSNADPDWMAMSTPTVATTRSAGAEPVNTRPNRSKPRPISGPTTSTQITDATHHDDPRLTVK